MSGKNFLKGAAILGFAGLVVKIIGAIYRIPLTNLIGTEGIGYFQPAYQVYNLVLVVSLAGFPTAVARLVSERRARGNLVEAHKIFRISLVLMIIVGTITSVSIFIFAKGISSFIGYPGTYYSLIALTPAILIVPLMSAYRGYFQGMQNMFPTAISQVIEQIIRIITGLYLANLLINDLPKAAGGASFGASVGGIAAFLCLLGFYFTRRKQLEKNIKLSDIKTSKKIKEVLKELLYIAVPITIGALIVPLMGLIDAKLVSLRLQEIGYSARIATDMYGQLSGTAQTFINFPQVFSVAVAMSLVPVIVDAFTKNKIEELNKVARLGLRTALIIGLPSSLGLFVLSEPIIRLFYPSIGSEKYSSVGSLLAILAVSVIFLTVVQSLTAILQSIDKQRIPVKNLAYGAIVKIIFTYILVGIPSINIKGAAYSTIIAYAVAAILNYIDIRRNTIIDLSILKIGFKPLVSSLIMTFFVYIVYKLSLGNLGIKSAAVMSIFAGMISYSTALLITGAIKEQDFKYLPKGEVICKYLYKIKLLKR